MPADKPVEDSDAEKWITVGGKKVKVNAGEDAEDRVREALPSLRGAKQSNTKEAQKSIYKKRLDLIKTPFKIRDEVVFAEYNKSGVISGFDGDKVKILSDGRNYPIIKNDVFLKKELLGEIHWDTMTNVDRVEILKLSNLPTFYNKQNWNNLATEIRQTILKNVSPAGTTTTTSGTHNPVYNPLNEEKSVSDRIDEEIKRQHESEGSEMDTGKDEKKGKD